MYSFLHAFLYLTLCFGDSSKVLGIAVAHSVDCYVLSHCMIILLLIHSSCCSWIFGFAYNWELLEMVLIWISWYMSFSAYLCMDFCWMYSQDWNCWVIGYTNVQFWERMPNSFTEWLWSLLYSWQSLFLYFWQEKVEWVGFLMSYRFLGTAYLFTNTTWMSIV